MLLKSLRGVKPIPHSVNIQGIVMLALVIWIVWSLIVWVTEMFEAPYFDLRESAEMLIDSFRWVKAWRER
jgi:hypothetical protein